MADYSVLCENQQIEIGKAGENLARSCTIDYSAWLKEYGEGDLRIRAIRSGDAEPYPVTNVTTENGVATWIFTDADTAIKGYGEIQILYYVEDVLVKSRVWRTYTHRSLSTSSEEAPDPYQDWLSEVERIGSQIEEDAESASDSATRAAGSASEAAESALSATRSESSAQEYASAASSSAESAASSASAASQSASEASTYEYYSEQYMNEAKSAKLGAESARTGAEDAKAAAQASATAAAQSAAQAEEAAESIEESADIIQKLMDNQIKDTATGTIASFPDGADMPMVSLISDIDPIQDLHGYDKPWVGGGGKNKFPLINGGTNHGITAVTNSDGSVTLNGTASGNGIFFTDYFTVKSGEYIITGNKPNNDAAVYLNGVSGSASEGARLTIPEDISVRGAVQVYDGKTVSNYTVYPMLRLATETDATYEPYSNICHISGWDSVDVSVCGINVWDEEWELGGLNPNTGEKNSVTDRIRSKNFIPVVPNQTYYFCNGTNNAVVYEYDADKNYLNKYVYKNPNQPTETMLPDCHYIMFYMVGAYGTTYNNDISINYPSTDHDYHAYQGQTYHTTLPQTVYGGTLDVVSGVLTVDRAMVDLGTLTYTKASDGVFFADITSLDPKETQTSSVANIICSQYATKSVYDVQASGSGIGYSTYNSSSTLFVGDARYTSASNFKTAMSGVQLVYELTTPQTYQLTPTQIDSLLGRNNVWADSGDVTVEYIADTKRYIQKVMGAIG